MLFKRKESKDSAKAKTSMFVRRAKQDENREAAHDAKSVDVARTPGDGENAQAKTISAGHGTGKTNANILRRPRITEKATMHTGNNVYTFDVLPAAGKRQIANAIKDVYNVTPVSIRVVTIPAKRRVNRRGIAGVQQGGKKAYVQLKKGETIELV